VAAPAGTTATICVSLQLVMVPAVIPLKVTVLSRWLAWKLEPKMVMDAPGAPPSGPIPEMNGAGTEK